MSGRFWLISALSLMAALLLGRSLFIGDVLVSESVNKRMLLVGDSEVIVEVADEEDEMNKGLGYRDEISSDSGMLFVYPQALIPTFWMKGMRFDLDFIWIRDGVVVELTKDVLSPESENEQLLLIKPRELSNWILEVNAGWVDENEVEVGGEVRFK